MYKIIVASFMGCMEYNWNSPIISKPIWNTHSLCENVLYVSQMRGMDFKWNSPFICKPI